MFSSKSKPKYEDHTVYRVLILPDMVKVSLIGVRSLTKSDENHMEVGWFNSVNELPNWVQERLAMLTMCNADRSRNKREEVPGIGRIISSDIFWVYA